MPLPKDPNNGSTSSGSRKNPLAGVRNALKKVFSFSKSTRKESGASLMGQPPYCSSGTEEVVTSEPHLVFPSSTDPRQQLLQQRDVGEEEGKEQSSRMAVFRKFLSATKIKMKPNNIKVDSNTTEQTDEEFEHRKQEWQEELDQMSDFLVLKSTEEQRQEGVDTPLDTAHIEDRDGLPMLKACFDIQHFSPEEIQLNVDDGFLTLFAQSLEEKDVAVFKKTMIRKIEIPRYVDHKMMHCSLSPNKKVLEVEMPFHLPPQKRPVGPTVVPVLNDPSGKRKIRLAFSVGPDFAHDDVSVQLDGERCLVVEASYEAEIGVYGSQVTRRQFYKKFRLPDFIHVEKVEHVLTNKGQLFVDLLLKGDPGFKADVTTETLEEDDVTSDGESSLLPQGVTEGEENEDGGRSQMQEKSESGNEEEEDDEDDDDDDDDDGDEETEEGKKNSND